jgi:hypothetical protein
MVYNYLKTLLLLANYENAQITYFIIQYWSL